MATEGELGRLGEKEEQTKAFWQEKRARYKAKKRQQKREAPHWAEGLSEDEIVATKAEYRRKESWKRTPLEEIAFQKPVVLIDLGFADKMAPKEVRSVVTQLSFTYGFLKSTEHPLELHLCSFDGPIKDALEGLQGFASWKVHRHQEECEALFPSHRLIYLSPDAPEELTGFEEGDVFVIGGIVDHNRMKVSKRIQIVPLELTSHLV